MRLTTRMTGVGSRLPSLLTIRRDRNVLRRDVFIPMYLGHKWCPRALAMSSDCCSVLVDLLAESRSFRLLSYVRPRWITAKAVRVEKKIGGSDFTICHCFFVCIYIPFANPEHLIEPIESARVTVVYVAILHFVFSSGIERFLWSITLSIPVPSLVVSDSRATKEMLVCGVASSD